MSRMARPSFPNHRAACLAVAGALLFGSSARGEPREPGRVRVVDGDTVAVSNFTSRLVGFDAPETGERARYEQNQHRVVFCLFTAMVLMVEDHSLVATCFTDRYARDLQRR